MRPSRSRRPHLNTSGVMRAHASVCSFRWSVFCISTWYSTSVFKCPLMSKSIGLRSGDLGGHSTGPQRPIQWPWNCHLTICAGTCRKYYSVCVETFESCSVVDKKAILFLELYQWSAVPNWVTQLYHWFTDYGTKTLLSVLKIIHSRLCKWVSG